MSVKLNHEIKCLARLDELVTTNLTILEFLVAEDLMTKEERKVVLASSDVPKSIHTFLAKMKGKQLQLLEYEWTLLPEERLKITIITDRNSKEFSFNY
jgi:hypothetical protein